ncbi:hypothetical protein ABIE69_002730 [Rhodobacteraceae bacterium MBR-64]
MERRLPGRNRQKRNTARHPALLALFRGVFGGIDHPTLRLPALGGTLFDPDRYPFLEGRKKGTSWRNDPAEPLSIDDRTVLLLLDAIQIFEGRTLSYRALDVEQIGHVYEGLLERTVKRVDDVTLELDSGAKAKIPRVTLGEMEWARLDGPVKVAELLKERSERSESAIRNALERAAEDRLAARLLTVCRGDVGLRDRILPYAPLLRTDPWGYDVKDRKLVVNEDEAATVRGIFERFVEVGSATVLARELRRKGLRNKQGTLVDKGYLYRVLVNRVYRGDAVHKGKAYPGEHQAIIDAQLWDQVHAILRQNPRKRANNTRAQAPALLKGLIFTATGAAMTPSSTKKGARRYRYYVSMDVIKNREPSDQGIPRRLTADLVESAVVTELRRVMRAPSITAQVIAHLAREGQASGGLQLRSAPEPGRVQRQPPRHGIHQGHLKIERGFVAGDPVLAEALQHRADVLVLELDGPLGPVVQQRNERAAMLGLAVAARGDVVGQHREVIRDDQVVLFIRPRPVRHCARLWARSVFVIRDFRQCPGPLRTLPLNS